MMKFILLTAFLLLSMAGISQTTLVIEDTTIYTKVDTPAAFPGGANAWVKFLNRNMRFPQEAINIKERKQWTVRIGFTVTKEGKVTDIRPESNHGLGLEAESMRLMRKSGNWIPAKLNGVKVNSRTMQPFVFVTD